MSILRLDKDSFAFSKSRKDYDDDKDTYAEFFENEAKSSTRSRVQNFYRPETTSGPLTEFINPKSRTARSDQKYEALYRRLLDVCLLFFQEVRSMSMQISNLQNKTTESVYHVCLKDILNWKKDTVDYWKLKCICRHKDFEYTFRLAFKKFMTDFYDDEDVFDNNLNTGIVIPSGSNGEKKTPSKTPTIFYNIPDVGEFFYNVICFMTQLPDVKSTKVLNNQTSLESCVYHSMNESMLQMSKDVIRTIESREVVSKEGQKGKEKNKLFYDYPDSVSVSSKKSKSSVRSKKVIQDQNYQSYQNFPMQTTPAIATGIEYPKEIVPGGGYPVEMNPYAIAQYFNNLPMQQAQVPQMQVPQMQVPLGYGGGGASGGGGDAGSVLRLKL
jgi:hypothetical protein